REAWTQSQANNLLGTFTFNSLADLQAGTPAAFSRQLAPTTVNGAQLVGALSLGDSWRPKPTLQIVYGVRADGARYVDRPAENPAVAAAFGGGARNSQVPNGIFVSPRLGFSWTYGISSQIGAFTGAQRVPRGTVRGGIGV